MSNRELHAVGGWGVEDNTYSEEEFYTKSVDGQGHQKHLRVNLPPGLFAQMNEVANDDGLPYRTIQDVARDAIYHRLKWLEVNKDALQGYEQMAQIARMSARLEAIRTMNQEMTAFIEGLEQGLNDATKSVDVLRVEDVTSLAAQTLDSVAGDQYEKVHRVWKEGQNWLRKFREQVDRL